MAYKRKYPYGKFNFKTKKLLYTHPLKNTEPLGRKKVAILKRLMRNQDKLVKLDAMYLTGKSMSTKEYKVRRNSLRLVFKKLERDAKKLEGIK